MNTTPLHNHQHLIVKADINKAPKTANEVGRMLVKIVKQIGMKIAVGPIAYYCTDEGNRGMTATAIIETSHVTCHVWDEPVPHQLQFDLYSCQDFDPEDVIEILDDAMNLGAGETILINRNPGESFAGVAGGTHTSNVDVRTLTQNKEWL